MPTKGPMSMIKINADGSIILSGRVAKPLLAVLSFFQDQADAVVRKEDVSDWECAFAEFALQDVKAGRIVNKLADKKIQFTWRGQKFSYPWRGE